MRVMILQPAEGTDREQARARAKVIAKLEAEGHEVWGEPYQQVPAPKDVNQELWQLGRRLQDMAGVDAVYFMDGWKNSRVCRMVYEAVKDSGIIQINSFTPQNLFSTTLLNKLTQNYTEIYAFIVCENEVYVQGKFVYNCENLELIARNIGVFNNPVTKNVQKWYYLQKSKLQEIRPLQGCLVKWETPRLYRGTGRV